MNKILFGAQSGQLGRIIHEKVLGQRRLGRVGVKGSECQCW